MSLIGIKQGTKNMFALLRDANMAPGRAMALKLSASAGTPYVTAQRYCSTRFALADKPPSGPRHGRGTQGKSSLLSKQSVPEFAALGCGRPVEFSSGFMRT
jgi:hypothetical protein